MSIPQEVKDLVGNENENPKGKLLSDSSINKPSPNLPPTHEKEILQDLNGNHLFPLLLELLDRTRGSLAAMKTLAFYSRENFKNPELGDYFYRVVSEDIEKTISLLDCFCEYLNVNTPVKKVDTIHKMIEEILAENQQELVNKEIKIIRKQFDPQLPETTLTDEQLRFIFNSIFQYLLFSTTQRGRIGIMTRSIDPEDWRGEQKALLQKNQKYIEVLIVSTQLDLKRDPMEIVPSLPKEEHERKMDIFLQLVKKTLEKNRGLMEAKWDAQKRMTILSVVLPIERRNVFQFLSPQDRLKKMERKD